MSEIRRPTPELHGPPDAPLVVALGGISAGAHVAAHAHDPTPGWWEAIVGPARAVDTRRWRVTSLDWRATVGGRTATTHDQADRLARRLDRLGVARAHAVVGASYGGMVALAFAERHPDRLERLVVVSAPHESHPFTTALRTVQRGIARLGAECGRERDGLALARALAMTTYRTADEFAARFAPVVPSSRDDDATFAVERYLRRQGERFADRFDARRFVALSRSADLHRVCPERITTPALVVAAAGDALVPEPQLRELARRLAGPARLVRLPARTGHDAFLAEPRNIGRVLAVALRPGAIA